MQIKISIFSMYSFIYTSACNIDEKKEAYVITVFFPVHDTRTDVRRGRQRK